MANIGKNIRILRAQKQMTQDELAEKLFVSRQTISNYETGRSQPDIDTLLRISEALGVGAQAILYGTPDTPEQLAAKKRAMGASFAVAGLAIIYHLLTQLRKVYLPHFLMAGLGYSLTLLLRPALFLLAGWALMQLTSVLTNARPLQGRWVKGVFWAVLTMVVVYCILVVPLCGWGLWSDWETWQLYWSGEEFSYSRFFSIAPWWDAAAAWLIRHPQLAWTLSPVAGVLLWLTGGKRKSASESQKPETTADTI